LYKKHAGISAQHLSDHHHTTLPEFNARPAATNQNGSTHNEGDEALKTPNKKGPLINTDKINYT
jgi:hypothetical protein